MCKQLVCLLSFFLIGCGVMFADIEHTVARGESIESIAEKYGISTKKLLEVNKDASTLFYIGQKLTIPVERSNEAVRTESGKGIERIHPTSTEEQRMAEEAKQHFRNKNWGKAAKTYSKLIKTYPKSIYYYNRGLSHFNNNKNRQAANDIQKALTMDDCTTLIRKNGPELLAEAQKRHQEWKADQINSIGAAILGVAAVGVSTWAAAEASKNNITNNSTLLNTASTSSYTTDATSDSSPSCSRCGGSGLCKRCKGEGVVYEYGPSSVTSKEKYVHKCGVCNGTGKCGACH